MRKKGAALFCSAVLLFVSVIGCSSDPKPAVESANKGDASTPKPAAKGPKMVFWDKSEYVKDYNEMQKARVEQFAKENNVDVEYVIVPPNDLKTKLLASIEAGNPPDLVATDDFLAKQFVGNNQLVDVSDLLKQLDFREEAKKLAFAKEGLFEVPQAFIANGMYIRKDKLDEKKLPLPKTWEDVRNVARAINDPKNNFYGVGFPLGASGGGDAEGWLGNIIRTYGNVIVNEKSEVTINAPDTLEALKFATTFFTENLTPPGSLTWDDTGNNNAYLAGTVGIVLNSGSIMSAMRKDKPDLAEKTIVLPYPAGPKAQFGSAGVNVFMMFKKGKNTDAAKKFIVDFYKKDYYGPLLEKLNGLWQPAINGYDNDPFWQKLENKGWYDGTKNVIPLGYPAPADEFASRVLSEQLITKGMQKILVNKLDPQKALDEIEKEYKRVYGKK